MKKKATSSEQSFQRETAPFAVIGGDRNTRAKAARTANNMVSVIDNEKSNFKSLNLTKLENSEYLSMM